jgi:hypothetical protein
VNQVLSGREMPKPTGKPKTSDITPEVYVVAAEEHATAALHLFHARQFVLGHYVAGLAVECIVRAYRVKRSAQFDERHDLHELARGARFFDLFPPDRVELLTSAFGVVTAQWVNAHRFRSEASLRKYLTERRLFAGEMDLLHARTRLIVNAAFNLVTLGVSRWQP